MSKYLNGKSKKDFDYDQNVIEATYCKTTGELANSYCPNTALGYYANNRLPNHCSSHGGSSLNDVESGADIDADINENEENGYENGGESQVESGIDSEQSQ